MSKEESNSTNGVTWRWVAIGAIALISTLMGPVVWAWSSWVTEKSSQVSVNTTRLDNHDKLFERIEENQKEMIKEIKKRNGK